MLPDSRQNMLLLVFVLCLLAFLALAQPGLCTPGPYLSEPAAESSPFPLAPGPWDQGWANTLPSSAASCPIGLLLQRAAERRLICGGVVVIGDHGGILSVTSRGRIDSSRSAPLLDEHTMFDLASLTKVVATAPAIMKLLDQGKIALSDPLSRWFPEFRNSRHTITVQELLTHTSGLTDRHLLPHQSIHGVALRAAWTQEVHTPGNRFQYADINFILLAELVHRVSGKPLNVFCREEFYGPLGMEKTMFQPPREVFRDLVRSTRFGKGQPQDADARRLGGVAGHAGLFSSAEDLSRYARFMLGHGSLEGRRVLSESAIAQMTAPHPCGSAAIERGLGWDIDSPFSAPKGTLFSKKSFGHTGYSGSSIWIDPESDLFVVVLANRCDFKDTRSFNQFRRNVSTLAAAEFGDRRAGPSFTALPRARDEILGITSSCLLPAGNSRVAVTPHHGWARQVRDHGKIASLHKQGKGRGSHLGGSMKRGHRSRYRT